MSAFAAFVAGRRTKWLVIAGWIVAVAALSPLGAKLSDVTNDDTESFLPAKAESTKVQRLLKERFPGGETSSGLIVYHRTGGLTAADRARIARDAQRVAKAIPVTRAPVVPFTPGAPRDLVSPRGDAAYTQVTVPTDFRKIAGWGKDARKVIEKPSGGVRVYLTGDLGLQADFEEVFGSLDTKLLFATVVLVLVLLGAIYRAPLIAVIPIVVVAFAYQVASGLIYLYAKSGETVSTNSTTILVVLMFGVGTDYCLLLVSRYREELHDVADRHQAMQRALVRAGPALLASGCTVITAMLVLVLADAGTVKSLGPVSAIGVASVLLAGLTLLPALLTSAGRRGFWPRSATIAHRPGEAVEEHPGVWRRVGDRVLQRPALTLGATVAFFAISSCGLLAYKEDYSIGSFFKKKVESVSGFDVLGRAFPSGALSPTAVIVHRDNGPVTSADVAQVRRRLQPIPGVASVSAQFQRSKDARYARVDVIFRNDPFSDAALKRIDVMRQRLRGLGPGTQALVGAGTAVQADFNKASRRDLRVIVPIALLVISLILALLLRALVAPVVLIATVVASFAGTMGLSIFVFIRVFGDKGVDASLPMFAFIFLVALGVDYTIFLMSRVREEAATHGTREGVLRALAATGPVITSAGVILAGTFSVLMSLPVSFAFNIGFMVAAGILLDTFVVRTLMVPAAVELLGDRIWWPSTATAGWRVLHESPEPDRMPAPEPAALD